MKPEVLSIALNETTHSLRFAESAVKRFTTDLDELEARSTAAASVAFIKNRLSDAQASLATAELEISRLVEQQSRSN